MSKFVSYFDGRKYEEVVHASGCSRAGRDARIAGSEAYPCADNARTVIIDAFSDIWGDAYETTEAAIADGSIEEYASSVRVCPCAKQAGFDENV